MAKNFINKAKTLSKKMINKIGNTKFAEKFMNDYVDTTGHKIGLGIAVVAAVVLSAMFYFAPLLRFNPFYVSVPEWMINSTMEDVSVIFLLVLLAYSLFVAVIGHCHANSYETEEIACE